ncbi:cation:proton antiporter, partial [Streptomyces chartreusis]
EPSLGPLATAYVLILVIVGPLTARYTEPLATRVTRWRTGRAAARQETMPTPEEPRRVIQGNGPAGSA